MNDNLKENNQSNFNNVLISNEIKEEKENNNLINNFPEWDLLPPYQTVRRINRK